MLTFDTNGNVLGDIQIQVKILDLMLLRVQHCHLEILDFFAHANKNGSSVNAACFAVN